MKYTLIKNTGYYPYRNIALEKTLFDGCRENEIILYLWVNDPCVIAGCNQNVLLEWDNTFLKENAIYPIRRLTGGGCVYHDRGNLNYSFIASLENKDIEKWLNIILDAVKSFGIPAEFSGRNDLVIGEKKFGGTAWLEEDGKILFHGTLMLEVDVERMVRCLTPNILKFEGKAISSVRSRVINLCDITPSLNREKLIEQIEQNFEQEYGALALGEIGENPQTEKMTEHLKSKEWIYHRNSDCDISLSYKIKHQVIQLDLKIKDNQIMAVNVFTDSLDISLVQKIKNHLQGLIYTEADFEDILNQLLN